MWRNNFLSRKVWEHLFARRKAANPCHPALHLSNENFFIDDEFFLILDSPLQKESRSMQFNERTNGVKVVTFCGEPKEGVALSNSYRILKRQIEWVLDLITSLKTSVDWIVVFCPTLFVLCVVTAEIRWLSSSFVSVDICQQLRFSFFWRTYSRRRAYQT